jgi:capsid protein
MHQLPGRLQPIQRVGWPVNLGTRIKAAFQILAGYEGVDWTPDRNTNVRPSQNAREDIPYAVWSKIRSWAREFERKDAIYNRYLDLREQYVVGPTGLRIVSASSDKEWAERANAQFRAWEPWADISSRQGFGTLQGLMERECGVVGGYFLHLRFGSTNKPRVKLIESESVATPPKFNTDPNVVDGIRLDADDRPEAYYIKPRDPRAEWPVIKAENMVHAFEPSRIGQVRELSPVYPVLKHMMDLGELQNLEMIAAKDNAKISKVIKTASGTISSADLIRSRFSAGSTSATGQPITVTKDQFYKSAVGAETVVLQNGDDMSVLTSGRPTVAMQGFWDYVATMQGAGLGVALEVILNKSMQGTTARAAYEMAAAYFRCRSAIQAGALARVWEHVIDNTPELRAGRPQDWRVTRYTPPRSINVDSGRNSTALINEWRAGFRTLESIAAEMGQEWEEFIIQRGIEFRRAKQEEGSDLEPNCILGGEPPAPEPIDPNAQPAPAPTP